MILRLFDAFCTELKFNMLVVVISPLLSSCWQIQIEPCENLPFKAAAHLILSVISLETEAIISFENFTVVWMRFFFNNISSIWTHIIFKLFLDGIWSFSFCGRASIGNTPVLRLLYVVIVQRAWWFAPINEQPADGIKPRVRRKRWGWNVSRVLFLTPW